MWGQLNAGPALCLIILFTLSIRTRLKYLIRRPGYAQLKKADVRDRVETFVCLLKGQEALHPVRIHPGQNEAAELRQGTAGIKRV